MIPSWLSFKNEKHPFRETGAIIISNRAWPSLDFITSESLSLKKELGGIGCYHGEGKSIVVDDFIQVRSFLLKNASFSISPNVMKSASEFHCSNKVPLIFHTHPSGNLEPSMNDRAISIKGGTIGCVISGIGTRCYAGTRDVPVVAR
jgi:hypothetical protein